MYAAIRHTERGTHSADDLAREGRALGALLGAAPGFIACLLLATPRGCAAVGIFEDASSLAAAGELVAGWASADGEAGWITGEVLAQRGL